MSGSGGTAKRSQMPVGYAADDLPLPSRIGNTPSCQFRLLAQPHLHDLTFPKTAKIPKLPLQKGRADVAALTTGIDRKV